MLPFLKGMKSLAQQQSLRELPWSPQQLELCGSAGKSQPCPLGVSAERAAGQSVAGRALQAEHELSVRLGLPGALAELPLPCLCHF